MATWAPPAATRIGVAGCLRGDHATDAARFSGLHFEPACHDRRLQLTAAETSVPQDRAASGRGSMGDADQRGEPIPKRIGSP